MSKSTPAAKLQPSMTATKRATDWQEFNFILNSSTVVCEYGQNEGIRANLEAFVLQVIEDTDLAETTLVIRISLPLKVTTISHATLSPLETAFRSAIATPGKVIERTGYKIEVLVLPSMLWHSDFMRSRSDIDLHQLDAALNSSTSIPVAAMALHTAFLSATDAIGEKFDRWLASLEGRRFDDKVAAERVATINDLANALGRELVLDGQRVRLFARVRANTNTAVLRAVSQDSGKARELWNRVALPRLSSRPIPVSR